MAEARNELRPALEAVLFDAGGTLVRLDLEWIARVANEHGAPTTFEALRRAEVRGRRMYDRNAHGPRERKPGQDPAEMGMASPTTVYWAGMLEGVGLRHPVLEEVLAVLWRRQVSDDFLWGVPVEGARAALDGVRALGLRAACVSNADGRAEEHLVRAGLREGLEFVLDSSREGVEKPDPEIFRRACARLGVAPERSLYVGDIRSVDEVGAAAAGMHFVLLDPFGDYAGESTPSITHVGELPRHVAERFTLPAALRSPQ